MDYNRIYITVSGTGDKQTCFCRNGKSFKASIDTLNVLRGFSFFNALWCSGNMLDFESSVSGSIPGGATKVIGLWFSAGLSLGLQPNRLVRYQKGVIGPQKIISHKISRFKKSFRDSLIKVYKRTVFYLERVKVFSPEMDFFTSSTVMPQRDLTGQDYFLITPPMIFKLFTA